MSLRQIVLDTETTGINVADGHRIIEIGCVELIDRKLTGKHFHFYLNPEREIQQEALAIHGITNEFLKDKPVFKDIAKQLIEFIQEAELIIHNAVFDVSFLNFELSITNAGFKLISDYCRVFDTLTLARKLHVGQRNSLDALCKRYGVDNTKRDLHGALLDANLLAQVYLAMTGGQGSFFDTLNDSSSFANQTKEAEATATVENFKIHVYHANEEELKAHEVYLQQMKQQGQCVWLDD